MKLLIVFSCLLWFGSTAQVKHTPIIFVHGMLASVDTWSNTIQQFWDAGYSLDELKTIFMLINSINVVNLY